MPATGATGFRGTGPSAYCDGPSLVVEVVDGDPEVAAEHLRQRLELAVGRLVLPVDLKGRACYRLGWGIHDSRPAAAVALRSLPSYFRQGGLSPRVSPLVELLP